MQMFVKQGKTYWKPTGTQELSSINGIAKWEQAFRVFSDIYTRAHPTRATELIQYNHVIHTSASVYVWENVYLYDKDFRIHMAKYPSRNWGIILQQAWNLRLRDKLRFEKNGGFAGNGGGSSSSSAGWSSSFNPQDFCKRFNRGRCTFGQSCRFEHRCFFCGKFGHGVINCRQLKAESKDYRSDRGYDRDHRDRYDRRDKFHDKHDRHDKFERRFSGGKSQEDKSKK